MYADIDLVWAWRPRQRRRSAEERRLIVEEALTGRMVRVLSVVDGHVRVPGAGNGHVARLGGGLLGCWIGCSKSVAARERALRQRALAGYHIVELSRYKEDLLLPGRLHD